MTYFDTSVLTAYYTTEERSPHAAVLVDNASLPVISDLAIAELNVAIWRKGKLGLLPMEAVAAVFSLFDEHLQNAFLNVSIEPRHIDATRALASRSPVRLRTLDALHLVIASELEATIATFDNRLHEAATALGHPVLP